MYKKKVNISKFKTLLSYHLNILSLIYLAILQTYNKNFNRPDKSLKIYDFLLLTFVIYLMLDLRQY